MLRRIDLFRIENSVRDRARSGYIPRVARSREHLNAKRMGVENKGELVDNSEERVELLIAVVMVSRLLLAPGHG